jgi:hypothetical protein
MRSTTALLVLLFIAIQSFGQTQFKKGYLINTDNQRIECFIKDIEWTVNPEEFVYKLDISGKANTGNLTSVKEFGIYNNCKYVNCNVRIDRSTRPVPGVKDDMAPVWNHESLFLNVVLEGKAKLYRYTDKKLERFFFSFKDDDIIPLIYKEINRGTTLVKNIDFRQQLWDKVRIPKSSLGLIKNVNYNEEDLKSYFESYNKLAEEKTM